MIPVPQPLRDYALLADGERGAIVGPRGEIAFLCAPQWHDDAVFSALLGGAGHYSVTPVGTRFVWGGSYVSGTLVWTSRWVTTDGVVESREALAIPGDRDRLVLLRRLQVLDGHVRLDVTLDARAGFGTHRMELEGQEHGVWRARTGGLHLRWSGVPGAAPDDGALRASLDLEAGGQRDLVLEIDRHEPAGPPPDPGRTWGQTLAEWAEAAPRFEACIAPEEARHSYAVLNGLTSASGAMVAAATTSLPERAEAGRNYDYRFAWVRDQCLVGQALAAVGGDPLLDDAVSVTTERLLADGERVSPAYTVDGDPVPEPRTLTLPGFPGGAEVHVGNGVRDQFQLDLYGEALLLLAAADGLGRLDGRGWEAVREAVRAVARRHSDPDAGIWELDARRWTHSRLICAAGLRAVAGRPGARFGALGGPDRLHRLADLLLGEASAQALHPSGRWQRAPDDPSVDSALLGAALRGGVAADDPRSVATWRAVVAELADDGYVYRFRPDERPLGEAEGAFLLSGFQLVLATHQQGDQALALRLFERNRGALGPPGLFTEEFDVRRRQLRGNLPQAFVHGLLIEAAHRLAEPAPKIDEGATEEETCPDGSW